MNTVTEQYQLLMTQSNFPAHFFLYILLSVIIVIILGNAWFAYSVYKTARLVSSEYRRFPLWLLWFFLVPVVNIIFQILILVFDLPRGLKLTFSDKRQVVSRAQSLFSVGIAFFVTIVLAWLLSGFMSFILGLVSLILMAIYWVKVVNIRGYCEGGG